MPTLGRGSWIGFAEESTWGTAEGRTNWLPVVSNALQRTQQRTPRADLHAGSSAVRRGHFDGFEEAGGAVTVLATYDNIGMLCKHALGALATTGAGPFTHTYTLAAELPTGLTVEGKRGTANSEVFEGCKINTATWECSSGAEMTLALDIIAETAATRGGSSSPTFADPAERILHHHSGTLGFGGSTYDLVSFRCTLNNAIARRNFLGSRVTKEPSRSDFSTVQMDLTVEAADALYTALQAGTAGDAVVTFTSGAKSIAFTLHNAYLTDAADPITGAGIVQQNLTLVGESDGTDEGLKVVIVNGSASGTAN